MIGHFEEKNENKYLVLDDVDENKEVSKKYEKVWEGGKKKLKRLMVPKKSNMEKTLKKIGLSLMMTCKKIDVSEGIDVNKINASNECELCHYWLFKDVGSKFEEHVCNGCHGLLTMANGLAKIATLSAKGATFRCI